MIQINGRSTPLKGDQLGAFLAQLPAGTVKNVEVATNPSAKDDPEGTAGIINIVLNQEAELGLSGGLSARHGIDRADERQRQHRQAAGQADDVRLGEHLSRSSARRRAPSRARISSIPVPAFTETNLAGKQSPVSGGGTVRTEYRFTDRNTLSFDGFFYGGQLRRRPVVGVHGSRRGARRSSACSIRRRRRSRATLSQDYDMTFRRFDAKNAPLFSTELEYSNNYNTIDIDLSGNVLQRRRVDAGGDSDGARPHDRPISVFQLEDGLHGAIRRGHQARDWDSRSRAARRRTTSTRPI